MANSERVSVEVVVVGGGIIGLSIARQLAVRGVQVAVVEQTRIGTGASGAAAGMLAAQVETEEDGPFFDLQVESRRLWRKWAATLPDETGMQLGYREEGIYRIAESEQEARQLQERLAWQQKKGFGGAWLDRQALKAQLPGLCDDVYGALYVPDDHQLDAALAVEALRRSVVGHGGNVLEGAHVLGLLQNGSRVTGVQTVGGIISASAVVLAGGMSVPLLLRPLGYRLPLMPIRGTVCALYPHAPFLKRTLFGTGWYVTPKSDGRLIVGATQEEGANTREVPVGALVTILQRAGKMLPELQRLPFHSAWSGIRTGTADRLPVIGPVPGVDGLFVATGHFRNGILLAPVTGEVMAGYILNEAHPTLDVRSFLPERVLESGAES